MIGEFIIIIAMSLLLLFWRGLGIWSFVGLIRQAIQSFKEKDIKDALFHCGVAFGYLLFFSAICGVNLWFSLPRYKVAVNRIPAYWEGKHLKPNYDDEVYFCTGEKSECYHYDEYCKGLRECGDMVVKKECCDAEDYGYRPCRICYMLDEKYYVESE